MRLSRKRDSELMDDQALSLYDHMQARVGLARLNQLSLASYALWRPIQEFLRRESLSHCRVLDLACGAGDVTLGLWKEAKRAGYDVHIDGCDRSEVACELARIAAEECGSPSQFFRMNVLEDELPSKYDVLVCSLFLHHLSTDEAAGLLRRMAVCAGSMFVVNDLERSRINLALVTAATRLVTRSPVVHFDGQASVHAAYTKDELFTLVNKAGLEKAVVLNDGLCRLNIIWSR